MALGEAILVCLAEEPLTGYDLAKSFDTSIGFFWRADHQQIYRELKRLKTNGWVADELVVQTSRPNKRRYSSTFSQIIQPKNLAHKLLVTRFFLD